MKESIQLNDYLGDRVLEQREERILALIESAQLEQMSLVLGAGISIPLGLPDWSELLRICFGSSLASNLLRKTVCTSETRGEIRDNPYNQVHRAWKESMEIQFNRLTMALTDLEKGVNPPLDSNALENGQYFYQCLDSIVEALGLEDRQFQDRLFMELVKQGVIPTKSLEEVSGTALDECAKLIKSGTVKSCITYNFDTLLEATLSSSYGLEIDKDYHVYVDAQDPIFGDGKPEIYHIHGSIPVPISKADHTVIQEGKQSKKIIFAEDDYYDIERISYNWTNLVQADFLQRSNCVFLGFSADDYNFRRIVKLMPKGDNCHYLFIALDGKIKACQKEFSGRRAAIAKFLKDSLEHEAIQIISLDSEQKVSPKSLMEKAIETVNKNYKDMMGAEVYLHDAMSDVRYATEVAPIDALPNLKQNIDDWVEEFLKEDKLSEQIMLNYYMELKDNYWSRYRMYPIWTTYDQLPKDIARLKVVS